MPLVKDKKGNWVWKGEKGEDALAQLGAVTGTGFKGETYEQEYERLLGAAKLTKGFDPGGQTLGALQEYVMKQPGLIARTQGSYIHDPDAHKRPAPTTTTTTTTPTTTTTTPTSGPTPEAVTGAPMFDIAAGYELDKIALARDIALSDAQNQIAQMGARILELESNMRGPQNAIQYSNLRYGLQDFAGGYPAFLNLSLIHI